MSLTDQQKADSVTLLSRMLTLLGYEATAVPKDDGEQFCVALKTEEPGRIIGRKGHSLQSLELLLNRMLRRNHPDCSWVDVDVDGYEKKRPRRAAKSERQVDEERLQRIAVDAAKEVKRWGQPKRIGPFNAAERRVVHMALKEDPDVNTESEESGKEGQKRVVIKLV